MGCSAIRTKCRAGSARWTNIRVHAPDRPSQAESNRDGPVCAGCLLLAPLTHDHSCTAQLWALAPCRCLPARRWERDFCSRRQAPQNLPKRRDLCAETQEPPSPIAKNRPKIGLSAGSSSTASFGGLGGGDSRYRTSRQPRSHRNQSPQVLIV